jgi:integrase
VKSEQRSGSPAEAGLLARLMEAVRPEFRGEVFFPPRDSPVFFRGLCRIPSCPTAMGTAASKQLCRRHYGRWLRLGRPELERWCEEEEAAAARRLAVRACEISGCERAHKARGLCHRHGRAWRYAGSPDLGAWIGRTVYVPPQRVPAETGCARPDCQRWTDGPSVVFCHGHDYQWRLAGRPAVADWLAELAHCGDPRVGFGGLARNLHLELQFGLQCRNDEGTKRTPVPGVVRAVTLIRESGVSSLLDLTCEQWQERLKGRDASVSALGKAFILDTRLRLQMLLAGDDPWADQYPRGTWDLRLLGITEEGIRYLEFDPVPQPWLLDLAKRWCRWRLSCGIAAGTVRRDLRAVISLARHLPASAGPGALTREQLEGWLAALSVQRPHPSRTQLIISVGVFLKDARRNEWEPPLPPGALIYHGDTPRKAPRNPRWIPEFLMRQMETPEALARFPSDFGRVLVQILMACGLRLKDARTLPLDCVTRDSSGAPYLAWLNRKMNDRAAFFPISESLADVIAGQQQRVRAAYPESPWLFPARQANLDGRRHTSDGQFRAELAAWLKRVELADEHGIPANVTSHQFRHTVATRLINADVPQHIVQQLLDHMSPEMTAVYARLHLDTVRRHWENALKVNADGDPAALPEDHPLATAQWMRLSMVRAKVTLPNGYCGAPVQTDCQHANPCLDCRFFITTPDFLAQHRRQREETSQMIAQAADSGLARIAESNTRVVGKLDKIITALEQAGPGQVVSGGKVTSLDAAG